MIANPILRGFYPDPSVCRVGADFYLACSTFSYTPGVPIFHSRDLVNWRALGPALTRPAQLPLTGGLAWEGIFAPTLRHHAGRFYLVTTNVGHGGNFLVTATDPAGPWSDPVWIDEGWFDPSLFFDHDGRVYYTRRGGVTSIVQAEIDVTTGRLLGPLREIATPFLTQDCEGPHLYHIGDWYYLLLAEGGSRTGHLASIGRARSPWGPFESSPHNPLVSNREALNHAVRTTGHAELFDAPDGSWWLACLGTRHEDYETFSYLGRESFLAPVEWSADGWPRLRGGTRAITLDPIPVPWPTSGTQRPSPEWITLRHPAAGAVERTGDQGRLRATPHGLDDDGAPAFCARRIDELDYTFEVALRLPEVGRTGISLFMNHRHHYDLVVENRGGRPTGYLRLRIGDLRSQSEGIDLSGTDTPLRLGFHFARGAVEFYVGTGETEARRWPRQDARYLAPEVAGTWTGLVAGVFAEAGGATTFRLLPPPSL